METILFSWAALIAFESGKLGPGDHWQTLQVNSQQRTYLVHVPTKYDAKSPMPVVLALHGATMSAKAMERFSGLNGKSDDAGFIVVYPNGSGPAPFLLTWNSGFASRLSGTKPDDVRFVGQVLDDLETRLNIDKHRIYATGISNGAMMCYRLASEMSERIAAIAPVAGAMPSEQYHPKNRVPVLHIHGTADLLVPFDGPSPNISAFMQFRSVPQTIEACAAANDCALDPEIKQLPAPKDRFKVTSKLYKSASNDADVILYVVEDGGHTWPGRAFGGAFLGPWTMNLDANDIIWEFFCRQRRK